MDKKEEFKIFAKKHPELINYLDNHKDMSWQKLYEIYDIYGEDTSVWKDYLKTSIKLPEFFNTFKNVNLDEVKEGIDNFQKILGMLSGLTSKNETTYKPRPIYKHFDD